MPSQIGISTGTQTDRFEINMDYDMGANGDQFVCDTVCARGSALYMKADGIASPVISTVAAAGLVYLGFVHQDVVAPGTLIELQFGYRATQYVAGSSAGDLVAIWQFGRFHFVNVQGVVASGVPVYPGTVAGSLSATQTLSQKAFGFCSKGNSGVSGGAITVTINLISGGF